MSPIHILNPMENAFGGSERRSLDLANLLANDADVKIWALDPPDPKLKALAPLVSVDLSKPSFPRTGTFIMVGCYFPVPGWVSLAKPDRFIVVYNIPNLEHLKGVLYLLGAYGIKRCDVVASSPLLVEQLRAVGIHSVGAEPSWIDLDRFAPLERPERPFTVGRLSRDVANKFHDEDPFLFRKLAEAGIRVRIMGGTCLPRGLREVENIELLHPGAEPAEQFLASLDAFVYRTADSWAESWGRVVTEAMATGLPVVLGRRIGAAAALNPPEDGLVFDSTEEALELVMELANDPERRRNIGLAARATIERIFSSDERRHWIDYYTRPYPSE